MGSPDQTRVNRGLSGLPGVLPGITSMDNPNYERDDVSPPPDYRDATIYPQLNGGGSKVVDGGTMEMPAKDPDPDLNLKKKPNGPVKKAYKRTKSRLQENRLTQKCFPPQGEVATTMTLILTIIAIFLAARTVLGPIADVGGTIFALLMLILIALIGGKLIMLLSWVLLRFCKIDVRLPPLLGMLVVGILLKNIPYNFGQFGRAECTADHKNATFVDSLTEFDTPVEHGSFGKRSISDDIEDEFDSEAFLDRVVRSVPVHDDSHDTHEEEDTCKERYIGHDLDPSISRTLRTICLTVILLMAGLELDPVALMKLSAMVLRATFIPCFVEALMVAILSHFILGFPWTVGFMLGFVLAAVSPAVIIPCLMSLSGRGYGVAKGIPTLVIAACSADDVVAISGFGIFLGITFNEDADTLQLALHGPIEVALGLSFGICWGILAQWLPDKNHPHGAFFRWLVLLGGGLIALFGAHLIHYDGAGGLATIIMAFVAGMEWRKEGWGNHNPVSKTFKRMWIILEPVIFALIGTEIQVDKINPETLGLSIVVLLIALVVRMVGTYFAVCGGDLTVREKIFMAFAWLPKATVQAALGPIFLDNVHKTADEDWSLLGDKEEWTQMGNGILTLAVLSILITAPLGAVCILGLGPKLLTSDDPEEVQEVEDRDIESKN